jgi:Ser/Thr protein kinase RdoA (MazF antagonist)
MDLKYLRNMNNLFPASYSTLSSQALADFVQERYGLAAVGCKMIMRGVGDTYLITGGVGDRSAGKETGGSDTRYILRVYRPDQRSLSQITAEISLLLGLKQKDVPVSFPVRDLSGTIIQTVNAVEGYKHMVLFTYAPGRSVSKLNEKQLYNLGYQMARFHEVSGSIELPDERWTFDTETTLFKPLEMLRAAFAEDAEGQAWMLQAAKNASGKLEQLETGTLPFGCVHYDFLPKNFHFEGEAITFFDFDFFGFGLLANDIMVFWQHLCLDVQFGRMTREEADEAYGVFLGGYQAVRPVSRRELAAVPYLSLGWWLFYGGFHSTHDQFYPLVQPAHFRLRVDLIRKLMETYWDKAVLPA